MGNNHVIKVITIIMIPFIMLFGLYVQFHGEYSAGGGFQAGVIIAASIIVYDLIFRLDSSEEFLNLEIIETFVAIGITIYMLVGVIGFLYGGNFLDYNSLSSAYDSNSGQKIGIFLVELGVGITVSSVMMLIYHMFKDAGKS